jgi:hypothetical protein
VERYRAKGLANSAACSDIRHCVPALAPQLMRGRWASGCSTVLACQRSMSSWAERLDALSLPSCPGVGRLQQLLRRSSLHIAAGSCRDAEGP